MRHHDTPCAGGPASARARACTPCRLIHHRPVFAPLFPPRCAPPGLPPPPTARPPSPRSLPGPSSPFVPLPPHPPSIMSTPSPEALSLIFDQLTDPLNVHIRSAESSLLSYLSDPSIIPALSRLLSHPSPQVRHLVSIVLRNALSRHWSAISRSSSSSPASASLLSDLKPRLLSLLASDPDVAARRGLISLCALLCKLQRAVWPELTDAALHLSQRAHDAGARASAYAILHALADACPDATLKHLQSICTLIANGLHDQAHPVRLNAARAYSACVTASLVRPDVSLIPLIQLLPTVGTMLSTCHAHTQAQAQQQQQLQQNNFNLHNSDADDFGRLAATVLEVCATILEIIPHTQTDNSPQNNNDTANYFNQFCRLSLHIFADPHTSTQARSAATEFLVFALAIRPISLRADGIALNVVQVACQVVLQDAARSVAEATALSSMHDAAITADGSDDDDADDADDTDDDQPSNLALRILYTIAKRPELSRLTFTHVMASVNQALTSGAQQQQAMKSNLPSTAVTPHAAAYRMISAIAEGCSYDLTQHVRDVVPLLVSGAHTDTYGLPTRTRALESLAFVCEALDTDELPDDILAQVSTSTLDAVLTALHHPDKALSKQACITLEPVLGTFANDADALSARFSDILRALAAVWAKGHTVEEAVMAIGVLAEHAPEALTQSEMYRDVIQWIIQMMSSTNNNNNTSNNNDDDTKRLSVRAAATNAASVLIAHCSDQQIIETLAAHAVTGLDSDDAQLRLASYSFFAKMADTLGGSVVAVFGPSVLQKAITSMERETITLRPGDSDDDDDDASATPLVDPRLFDTSLSKAGSGKRGTLNDDGGGDLDEDIEEEEDDDDDDDDDDDENGMSNDTKYNVHSAYLDEKMGAVSVAGAFATACGTDGYVESISASGSADVALQVKGLFARCVDLVQDLTRYYQDDIRTAAYLSLARMAVANDILQKGQQPSLAFSPRDLVRDMFPLLDLAVQEEDDIEVMTSVLSWYASFFRRVPPATLFDLRHSVVKVIELCLRRDTLCQVQVAVDDVAHPAARLLAASNGTDTLNGNGNGNDNNDNDGDDCDGDDDDDDEEEVGDSEGSLMESVGEMIVSMACVLRGYFAADFARLLSLMLDSIGVSTPGTKKSTNSAAAAAAAQNHRLRATFLGTIAAVLLYLNWDRCDNNNSDPASFPLAVPAAGSAEHELALRVADQTAAQLLPVAADAVRAHSKTLRQNGMFLVGVVFAHSRLDNAATWGLLPQVLKSLEDMIRTHSSSGGGGGGNNNTSSSSHTNGDDTGNSPNSTNPSSSSSSPSSTPASQVVANHGALVDNAAGALARIFRRLCLAPADAQLRFLSASQRAGLLHTVVACIPVRNDPMENTTIAKALVTAPLDILTASPAIARNAVQSLVTAVLACADVVASKGQCKEAWVPDRDRDACDEAAWMTVEDVVCLVKRLKTLSEVVGQVELAKLNLSQQQQKTVSDLIASLPAAA